MISKKIFLIGMPGCGKSTVGKLLSNKLDYQFFDLDDVIETSTGKTIHELFKNSENDFRRIEQTELKKVIELNTNVVIACGGGTPCFHDNMNDMLNAGTVVYLRTEIDVLEHRLKNESHLRPLLQSNSNLLKRLTELLELRRVIYNKAQIIIQCKTSSAETIADLIVNQLK